MGMRSLHLLLRCHSLLLAALLLLGVVLPLLPAPLAHRSGGVYCPGGCRPAGAVGVRSLRFLLLLLLLLLHCHHLL